MGLKSFKVVQDLREAGMQSANGIGQPGGDSLYYSCQRQPRSLFLEQQIRAVPWTRPRLCQGVLFNSRQQFQVQSAAAHCKPVLPRHGVSLSALALGFRGHLTIYFDSFFSRTEYTGESNLPMHLLVFPESWLGDEAYPVRPRFVCHFL